MKGWVKSYPQTFDTRATICLFFRSNHLNRPRPSVKAYFSVVIYIFPKSGRECGSDVENMWHELHRTAPHLKLRVKKKIAKWMKTVEWLNEWMNAWIKDYLDIEVRICVEYLSHCSGYNSALLIPLRVLSFSVHGFKVGSHTEGFPCPSLPVRKYASIVLFTDLQGTKKKH